MTTLEGIFPINTKSGIKRDGTEFEGNYYVDGHWCRFQRGKPRKIRGYQAITDGFNGPVRGAFLDGSNGFNYIYGGSANSLEMIIVSDTGGGGGIIDRTPASGFAPNSDNIWQFDTLFDAGGSARRILAHAAPNLTAIDSTAQQPIWYGDANGAGHLITTGTSVSGGVFSLPPYAMALDNDGYAIWTPPNEPNDFGDTMAGGGSARIAPNKLIKGMRTRGGSGYAPAGLIWSLNELYRTFFIGGAPVFEFDYIGDTELLSTSAVVEYNGRYYWPDLNGFKSFAGSIEDMPNDMNTNFFYDNVNIAQRQKVWGFKNPRWNEIWWLWPFGMNDECSHVIIYNVAENTWYDTTWAVDQKARSSGFFSKSYQFPVMFGLDPNAGGTYTLWQHESGVDRVENNQTFAIDSYFETADISYCTPDGGLSIMTGEDKWVELMRVEPDFVQVGDMTITVKGQPYASQPSVDSGPYVFSPNTNKVDMKEQRRQLRLRFESNVAGGDYQLGKTLLHMSVGDGRQ